MVETAEQLLDQRHLDADRLAAMLAEAKDAAGRFAAEEEIEVAWERIWGIEPILFDETLIGLAEEAIVEVAGTSHRLPSGPLHDAAEVARAGIPTVMLFVQSLRGLSHTKLEDTKPEHLELSVRALDGLAAKVLAGARGLIESERRSQAALRFERQALSRNTDAGDASSTLHDSPASDSNRPPRLPPVERASPAAAGVDRSKSGRFATDDFERELGRTLAAAVCRSRTCRLRRRIGRSILTPRCNSE